MSTWRRRAAIALASAACLHVAVLALLHRQSVREVTRAAPRVVLTFVEAPRAPAPPVREARPPERTPPPSTPTASDAPVEVREPVAPAPPDDDVAPTESAHAPAAGPRVAPDESMRDVIRGTAGGPAPSIATLESATGIRVVGPESDTARAGRLAKANLESDLSAHDVARGLADDWFRRRRADVARTWQPQDRELDDGGKEVRATELFTRTLMNPLHWKEASKAIAGDASALAESQTAFDRASAIQQMMMPHVKANETDEERRVRLLGSLNTHREAFATKVGLEIRVRHRGDGSVELIEITAPSGQVRIDEGAAEAFARALALDPTDTAPLAIAKGQPFATRWALDVKWELNVPKCSLLSSGTGAAAGIAAGEALPIGCGTSFGNDGVDIPFTVKKNRRVELIAIERL